MHRLCRNRLIIIQEDYNKIKESFSVHKKISLKLKNNMIIKINNWKS